MPIDQARARLLTLAKKALDGGPSLLEAISWPRELERRFFARKCAEVPAPRYDIDKQAVIERLARIDSFERELLGDDAIVRLLRSQVESHRLGARMLLAAGTREFFELSCKAYGGATTTSFDSDTTNLDFADHLLARIGRGERSDDAEEASFRYSAGGLASYIQEKLARRKGAPAVDVLLDDELGAKAIAGRTRLRIRADATFEAEEARSLFLHEVETHIFTAQNGHQQPNLRFLQSGGPCATKTQEGLAVFAELYAHALTLGRLRRLVERVHLVAMAEDGASFVDLYRHLVDKGSEPGAAYLDVARVYRGGVPSGGAPFTKDACYLAGLVEVYDFLRIAVAHDRTTVPEVLISGRLRIEDVEPLLSLREDGVLAPPTHRPSWLRRWEDLLTHFAFTSFLAEIDLGHVAKRYAYLHR
ncbi:MAG: DUF1704 domain-containing protein [Myxococcales bacterium]|nr:DUF1704 domain-containing protein [Myxococcales bacterium]